MNVLLFGVSCVGKTTVGKIVANKLGWHFYDLDDEVKKYYHCTLEKFVNSGTRYERDEKRIKVVKRLIHKDGNKIIAITPMGYKQHVDQMLEMKDVTSIELVDTAENIFERLVFSDENDVAYTDDEYKMKHKDYYIKDIQEDLMFYGLNYLSVPFQVMVDNRKPDEVADDVISCIEK